jgi:hypothetical protein
LEKELDTFEGRRENKGISTEGRGRITEQEGKGKND